MYFINIHIYLSSSNRRNACLSIGCSIGSITLRRRPRNWAHVPRANVGILWQTSHLFSLLYLLHDIPDTLCIGTSYRSSTHLPVLCGNGWISIFICCRWNSWRYVCWSRTECTNDDLYCITFCKKDKATPYIYIKKQ